MPTFGDVDGITIAVAYGRTTDTLSVSFTGTPRPAIGVDADDDTISRVDPETEEVSGLEIEDFLARYLRRPRSADEASAASTTVRPAPVPASCRPGQQEPRR